MREGRRGWEGRVRVEGRGEGKGKRGREGREEGGEGRGRGGEREGGGRDGRERGEGGQHHVRPTNLFNSERRYLINRLSAFPLEACNN